jgi:hypothetical protein
VWIEEHKPISKLKRWIVAKGEKRARIDEPADETGKRVSKKKGGKEAAAPAN